jgi:hypothetical protein
MKISIDNGLTWQDVESVRVSQEIPDIFNDEKFEIELLFNFTNEGLIQDLWIDNVSEGSISETYQEIGDRMSRT